jgi:hypothetical protein
VGIARRQRPRQVAPTGLLHIAMVVAFGRIGFEANPTSRVGKILRQRRQRDASRKDPTESS